MTEEANNDTRPTVLVVDDNDELRGLLRVWLGKYGCRVVEAADGPTAVIVAQRERPDLIFMDLHMPKMDGFAAAYRIRSLAMLDEQMPIIAVSADGALGIEARQPSTEAYDVGFTDFVPKPFSPGQLKDILTHYLPGSAGMLKM